MVNELFFDLYAVPRMTEFRLKNLLARLGSPEAIFGADEADLTDVTGVDAELARAIIGYQRRPGLAEQIARAEALGVRVVSYLDEDFPFNLRGVAHMPPVLFMRGEISSTDKQAVAVVGTRSPSHYGRMVAERIARELALSGVTVVSGLARGVDTFAHRGALAGGGRTIAVLGCGIDVYYPPENRQLCEAIVNQGAVVSEFPLGTEPLAMNSALARAVVAVEAGDRSGVLNTCAWAQEQGRTVFAVPGRIGDEKSTGTNRLLRDGAKIVTATDEILSFLGRGRVTEPSVAGAPVAEEEKPVLNALTAEPRHIDELCEILGMPMAELLNILFQLEIKGLITQLPGKFFARTV